MFLSATVFGNGGGRSSADKRSGCSGSHLVRILLDHYLLGRCAPKIEGVAIRNGFYDTFNFCVLRTAEFPM